MLNALCQFLVIFAEPGFPVLDVDPNLVDIPGAQVARSVTELEALLTPERVLVWRHGSTFPAEALPLLVRFLESGGSLLYLGGAPFTHPVTGAPGSRVIQPRTTALLKELRLNQCYRLPAANAELKYAPRAQDSLPARTLDGDSMVFVLEPRLSETRDSETEDGAPGSRDGVIRPLSYIYRPGEDPRFPAAAASYAISRLRGRYAGGQWVFHLLSSPPSKAELAYLVEQACRPVAELRVDPTFGCFHQGEQPSVILRLDRPGAEAPAEFNIDLFIEGPQGRRSQQNAVTLRADQHGTLRVPLDIGDKPGLYRVTSQCSELDPAVTGFWIYDDALFRSGDELSFDQYTLLRNNRPNPVVGTTTMSATVHRKFLFEPNAAVWDDTFAELASLNINLVRTGVWSAYRKIMLDPNVIDEAWLRALEAYYLSARRHGIPVIFTFFAFVPERYGGDNPYFDPRALEGQRAYVSAVASRFAHAKEIMWDLINEPSFSSPDKLWQCRPHGDAHELRAFTSWLQQRYSASNSSSGTGSWQDTVRARWRVRADEPIALPTDQDFDDRHVLGPAHPYQAKEYLHFAQDAFEQWAADLTTTIRQAGSSAAITVGQDEGGLFQRPSPLHHFNSVDFTSMHTWWLNDELLSDGILAKAPGKPLLISETGVMQRELLSGEALRDPQESALLLARKMAYAIASGAFGVVQWCYDVNPYMDLDNEVAIGARRVDGSYKPEHGVIRRFAAFVERNKERFVQPGRPEIAVILPATDQFSIRNVQTPAIRRSIRLLAEELGYNIQVVAENRTADALMHEKLIVVPACTGLSESCWQDLQSSVRRGSVLLLSGWFETDDAGLPAKRLSATRRPLRTREVLTVADDSPPATLRYPRSRAESWYAADHTEFPRRIRLGRGRILHYPVPLEWAEYHAIIRHIYEDALNEAQVSPPPVNAGMTAGVFLGCRQFGDNTLLIAVNESSTDASIPIVRPNSNNQSKLLDLHVPQGAAQMIWLDRNDQIVDSLLPIH